MAPITKQPGERLTAEIESHNGLSRACGVLLDGLEAVDGNGKPDWRVRQESARQIMDRVDGRPIERQLVQHQHVKSGPTLAELLTTPGAMASLVEAIPPADRTKLARVLAELPATVES